MIENKIDVLRKKLIKYKLDGYIVTHNDEFFNESIPDCNKRLEWLTSFDGSAGTCLILIDKAYLFVDGRYTTQAKLQVDNKIYEIVHLNKNNFYHVLKNFNKNLNIGFDPKLHSVFNIKFIKNQLIDTEVKLIPISNNLIDLIWKEKPQINYNKIENYSAEYSGKSSNEKINLVCKFLNKNSSDSIIITDCESISWLLNIRGSDLEFTPIAFVYLVVSIDKKISLFTNSDYNPDLEKDLEGQLIVNSIKDFYPYIEKLGKNKKTVIIDDKTCSYHILELLKKNNTNVIKKNNPCLYYKACKNKIEIKGIVEAHIRDGKSISQAIYWLKNNFLKESIDELMVANKMFDLRKDNKNFISLSFPTIAGTGPNAAIIHYRPTISSSRKIKESDLLLIDSGAQYLDGTTDATRTICLGGPTIEQKRNFTKVLKGHIALAKAVFPIGTCGHQIDILARKFLWEDGLDYDHGTGHGVGSFLNVHEGPQSISKHPNTTPLEPGMIISNEPGFYKEGEYGIRIENLVLVEEKSKGFLGFETITLAPIDKTLIANELLDKTDVEWINNYHKKVFKKISNHLNTNEKFWLKKETDPIN